MRTTFATVQRGLLHTLGSIGGALARTTAHLSSGRRITAASEDGPGAARVAVIREEIVRNEARRRSVDGARGFVSATDSALEAVSDLVRAALVEGQKALSGTNAGVRDELATQIDGFREQMLLLTRTQYQGRYIFAGTATLQVPFDAAGNYLGDSGSIEARIDDQLSLTVNQPGDAVFRNGVDILGALSSLSTALRAGDEPGMRAAENEIARAVDQVASARVVAGVRLQALDAAASSLLARDTQLREELGRVEDADIPAEATRAARLQTASEAALTVLSRTGSRNLFDFLA